MNHAHPAVTPHINCDMGENYGAYTLIYDVQLMPYIDACNIACGYHAGDPVTIQRTIESALQHNVEIGAHPGYPDLQGFGRRYMDIDAETLEAMILYQISALQGMTQALGGRMTHVKAHGALYNQAARDEQTARAIVTAVKRCHTTLILYAPPHSILEAVGQQQGLQIKREGFVDRRYHSDGRLVSRLIKGAVITDVDDAVRQAQSMVAHQQVNTIEGGSLSLAVDTMCIHGDNPSALVILQSLKSLR